MNRKEDANFFWCDAYVIFFFCMIIQTNSSSLPFDIFYFHVPIKFNRHFDCQDVLVLGMTLFLVCYSSAFITGVQNIKWVFQLFLISVYIVMYYFCSFLFWKRLWLKLSSLFNSCNVLIVINWPSQRKKKKQYHLRQFFCNAKELIRSPLMHLWKNRLPPNGFWPEPLLLLQHVFSFCVRCNALSIAFVEGHKTFMRSLWFLSHKHTSTAHLQQAQTPSAVNLQSIFMKLRKDDAMSWFGTFCICGSSERREELWQEEVDVVVMCSMLGIGDRYICFQK